jgi:hypothetical protein
LAELPNVKRRLLGSMVRIRRSRSLRTSSLIRNSSVVGRSWTTKSSRHWDSSALNRFRETCDRRPWWPDVCACGDDDSGCADDGPGEGHGLGFADALGAGSEDGPATEVVGVWNSLRTSTSVGLMLGDAGSDGA